MGLLTLFFIFEVLALCFLLNTLATTRAFVSGDALWSKAQKDAVYQLQTYAYTLNEVHYRRYIQYIKIPVGVRLARLELQKQKPDYELAKAELVIGQNNPQDINRMIPAFTRLKSVQFIKNVRQIWMLSDKSIDQLLEIGQKIHSEIKSHKPSPSRLNALLLELNSTNEELRLLSVRFSSTLGNGCRWLENFTIYLLFIMALTVIAFRFALTYNLSKRISKGLNEIIDSADKVARNDFSSRMVAYSKDEIGHLIRSFNHMTDNLEHNLNKRKLAEIDIKDNQRALDKTEHLAHVGSWEWDIVNDKITWSEELYRIYGLKKNDFKADYKFFLECIHPDDREYVAKIVRTAGEQKKGINYFHKIIRKSDGAIRIVNGRGRAIVENGKVIKYVGTAQDVTEAVLAEQEIHNSQLALAEAQQIAHIGSWEWNVKANIILWSEELYRIYGLEPSEFEATYESFLECVYPEDKAYVSKLILDAGKNKKELDYFHRITRKSDGKIRMLKCYGKAVVNEHNQLVKFTGTAQDVTEAKQFEDRIKELSLIASESKNGILILDKFGKVEWVNDGFTKLSGYTLDEVSGTTADILRKGKDSGLKPGTLTYETLVKERKPLIYEAENYTKDGRKYWAQTTLSPLFDEQGEIYKIIAIDSDITRLKKTEKELIKAKEKAEQSKKAKEQFLANMSHEIRTPMNGIIGFARLLEDSSLTPEQKEYLKAIETSGTNLLVIINDILDFSKLEAGKIVFEERKIDVHECVGNAIRILKSKLTDSKVKLYEVIDSNVPHELLGDEVRLSQILINLVSNSIKFTNEGEIKVSVKQLREYDNSIELEFRVSDTGWKFRCNSPHLTA